MGADMTPAEELYLVQILNQARDHAFAWGRNDCNTLGLTWVDFLCGTNYLSTTRGSYCDARSAIKYAKSMPRWCQGLSELGWFEVGFSGTRQGDLAVIEDEAFDRVHIVTGRHVVSLDEANGYVRHPIEQFSHARFWSFF